MVQDHASDAGGKAGPRALVALAVFAGLVGVLIWAQPDQLYLWVKAGHVITVIAWMAGMLYLPRLFVYHSQVTAGSQQSETFKVMETRLYRFIMTPAMILTWTFGLWLAWRGFAFQGGWLHAKIAAVLVLSGMHGYLGGAVRRYGADRETRTTRHWRLINEVPTLLMIVIVVLVIVKPF